ncbi:MAG: DUF5916 domain-containing protein [Gemmatimonadota bacterium]
MSRLPVFLAVLCAPLSLVAQNIHSTPPPEVRAVPLQGEFRLDGRLDEPVWQTAPVATDFLQNQPHQGERATQRTEVRFAFDAAAIYVGARMYDDSGARGVQTRLVRRDADFSSDYIQVIFDTYHDHIGRLFFLVNPSGVKQDANGLGGGGDPSWDPVWEVQTNIDSLGWTAEMRIPFSQLRYPSTAEEQMWGLQIWRQENRLNELSQWSYWRPDEAGGPPRFGHLSGLVIHEAPGRAEVLPYVVGRSANVPGDPSDPFFDPHAVDGRVGADAMLRVTSNLTLNATVNPDFGQVEVDPAVVNLGTFETFFPEKRPFFVEGAGYFGIGGFSCYFCSNVSSLSMLNTRRIGREPQMSAVRDSVEYADEPDNTRIIAALKLTGRTSSAWSIGALNSLTARESAPVALNDSVGTRSTRIVEPLTNYFAGRVAKDLRGGATVIKVMGTSVYRQLDDPYIRERLSRNSEALGVSTEMWWSKRTYRLMAQVAGTHVAGDTAAIRRVKTSQRHFFQRPDRSDTLDVRRPWTSMTGLGGYARISKESGGLLWEGMVNFRTPSYDNNDITILTQGDYVWMGANLFPLWTKPSSWYRQLFLIGGAQQQYNLDGDLTQRQFHAFAQMQSLGYWWFTTFWIHRPGVLDDRLTRGGPVVGRPRSDFISAGIRSDSRKAVVGDLNLEGGCNGDGDCQRSAFLSLELRPRSNVTVALGPSVSNSHTGVQAVGTYGGANSTAFYGTHYVFGQLERNEIGMDTRLNVTFSPLLTLELYMQPFISAGDYTSYNEFAATRSTRRLTYGTDMGTMGVTPDTAGGPSTIVLDTDGPGGDSSFTFTDPSFTFRSLRGNAVLRWEYRPGSTIFLVWTRNGATQVPRGQIDWSTDSRALFQGPSENIFMVKVNYWLGF